MTYARQISAAVPIDDSSPRSGLRIRVPEWVAPAWGAIGATALFLGITCWWLSQDRSIPIFDAGLHLSFVFRVHRELAAGALGNALTLTFPYPPLAYLIGSLGIAIGGVGVAPPILAENFVFVPLLAFGCYHVGRLVFNPLAGMLAVIFALGTPLMIAQLHVFMVDAPETAMVAVTVWAILATDSFSRVGISALAGVTFGLGALSKEPFIFFVLGPLLVTIVRGRFQQWRGILAFAVVASAIAAPWWIHELSRIQAIGEGSVNVGGNQTADPNDLVPAHYSLDNFTWYFWNLINAQVYLPLLLFSTIGWWWAVIGFARRRPVSRLATELTVGAFISWLAITETFAHDTRYSMPLLLYLAVFAGVWITQLPRRARVIAASALIALVIANTLGTTFGVGQRVSFRLASATSHRQQPGLVVLFQPVGFLVGKPMHDDLTPILRALRHRGVEEVLLSPSTLNDAVFSEAGVTALAEVYGLRARVLGAPPDASNRYAVFANAPIEQGFGTPCLTLSDGSGVWIAIGNVPVPHTQLFCPSHRPQFYEG